MTTKNFIFMDGTRVTPGSENCRCTASCEFPCWQRIGLTSEPCCAACGPLPEPEQADLIPLERR